MALESTPGQAFLGGEPEDDFAALDSMAFTGTQSQFGMQTATPPASSLGGSHHSSASGAAAGAAGGVGRVADGTGAGYAGVSESLFDRIRARTAEQQKQSMAAPAAPPQPSGFAAPPSQPPSGQPIMELENNLPGFGGGNANAVAPVVPPAAAAPAPPPPANETTYSFSASAGGEDFSSAPQVPQYGRSPEDPYTAAYNAQTHPQPTLQDKAGAALASTGEAMKSLFGAGLNGARAVGAMAQDRMGGGGAGGPPGARSYNNNFLLREDSLEEGAMGAAMGNPATNDPAAMSGIGSQPPPPVSAAVASGEATGPGTAQKAYSMFAYGKTFCEDLGGFFMQLPLWGKGFAGLVLLWVLYSLFG